MTYREVAIECEASELERIESALEHAGALSVTLADAGDAPLFEPAPGAMPVWQKVAVSALFTDLPDLRERLAKWLSPSDLDRLGERRVGDRDWTSAWRQHVRERRYGDRLAVLPLDAEPAPNIAAVVRLDPGLAFGTGSHPSTDMCLAWLAELDLDGRVVLDYGSGSGILSVAAAKLGARRVLAVDHDPQACEATRRNAERNGLAPSDVQVMNEPGPGLPGADVIVANILARPLIDLAGRLRSLAAGGAQVALAGLLEEQSEAVAAAYAAWVALRVGARNQQWVRLQGQAR